MNAFVSNLHRPVAEPQMHMGRQQGIALVMGLIILLILTIMGVTAIKSTTSQERMASNFQQQAQTFHGAESAIRLAYLQLRQPLLANMRLSPGIDHNTDILSRVNTTKKTTEEGTSKDDALTDPDGVANGVIQIIASKASAGGSGLDSRANIYATERNMIQLPPADGIKLDAAGGGYFTFEINAVSRQPGTGARTQNIQGIAYAGPSSGLTY